MIPFYQARVGDVQEGVATLTARCMVCDHCGPVDAAALLARYGPHERLTFVEKKLACRGCGNNAMCSLSVAWA